jgi:hypothetical protein
MEKQFVSLSLVLSAVVIGACARNSIHYESDLARLRAATQPYHNLDSAVAVGYPRVVKDCIVHEHHGAMGYHHVNRSYIDTKRDVTRPQILLYERMPDSTYRLNGVEFVIPYRIWPADSVAPVMFGQTMHHETNLKYWYLHVWAWRDNSEGIFANFNSDVNCPDSSSRKVYIAVPAEG